MKHTNKLLTPNHYIGMAEVPDEIALCINISECPIKCIGCHSPYLQTSIGNELNEKLLDTLIKDNEGITNISFMGGDNNKKLVLKYAKYIKEKYKDITTCWFSGKQFIGSILDNKNNVNKEEYKELLVLDYIKVGPYIKQLGGLDSKSTNQRMYKQTNGIFKDITNWYTRNK